jgi:hypothetical protein
MHKKYQKYLDSALLNNARMLSSILVMELMNNWTGNLQLNLGVLKAKKFHTNGEIPLLFNFPIIKGGDI